MVSQRPHDPAAEPVRLSGEAVDEVEDRLQMPPVPDVSGEDERAVPARTSGELVDEAERAEDLLQRLQLAVHIADHSHPLRAILEELRDVAVRCEAALDRHVLDEDVLHFKHVQFMRREPDFEAPPRQLVSGPDVHLTGEEVAQVIVDGGVVLHIEFGREPQSSPVFRELGTALRDICRQDEVDGHHNFKPARNWASGRSSCIPSTGTERS